MPRQQTTLLFEVPAPGVSRRQLRAFAGRLASEVAGGHPFCCVITSDGALRRLNRQFLKKDYSTDVLSFPAAEKNGALGEIAISFGRAKAQAAAFRHSIEQEIGILMLHGVLHLLGMDHTGDRGQMARAERRWRDALGLPAGLIERARA